MKAKQKCSDDCHSRPVKRTDGLQFNYPSTSHKAIADENVTRNLHFSFRSKSTKWGWKAMEEPLKTLFLGIVRSARNPYLCIRITMNTFYTSKV